MGQYWMRKGDKDDKDERTAKFGAETRVKGDRFVPENYSDNVTKQQNEPAE